MAEEPTATASGGFVTRLLGFAGLPLLALVMPLLLLPILRGVIDPVGWSSVMSGQSIGTIAAVIIMWGWNVDGTVTIARAVAAADRTSAYGSSIRTRLLLSLAVLPATVLVTVVVARPGFEAPSVAMALGYALAGFSPAWFAIGAGRPLLLGLYDTLPRFLATLVAAPVIWLTGTVWAFPIATAVSLVVALALFGARHAPGASWWPSDVRATLAALGEQRHTAAISLTGQVYAQTPAPIATATALTPALALAAGQLASTDTIYRLGLFSAVALGNAFQAWTLEPGLADPRRRHLAAIAAHAGLGAAGLGILVALGPLVSPLIAPDGAAATIDYCLAYGLAFAFLSAATPLIRNLLIPAGRQPLVLVITLAAAVVGLAVMLASGLGGWTLGVAYGMAASELVMLIALLPPALRVLNQEGAHA